MVWKDLAYHWIMNYVPPKEVICFLKKQLCVHSKVFHFRKVYNMLSDNDLATFLIA